MLFEQVCIVCTRFFPTMPKAKELRATSPEIELYLYTLAVVMVCHAESSVNSLQLLSDISSDINNRYRVCCSNLYVDLGILELAVGFFKHYLKTKYMWTIESKRYHSDGGKQFLGGLAAVYESSVHKSDLVYSIKLPVYSRVVDLSVETAISELTGFVYSEFCNLCKITGYYSTTGSRCLNDVITVDMLLSHQALFLARIHSLENEITSLRTSSSTVSTPNIVARKPFHELTPKYQRTVIQKVRDIVGNVYQSEGIENLVQQPSKSTTVTDYNAEASTTCSTVHDRYINEVAVLCSNDTEFNTAMNQMKRKYYTYSTVQKELAIAVLDAAVTIVLKQQGDLEKRPAYLTAANATCVHLNSIQGIVICCICTMHYCTIERPLHFCCVGGLCSHCLLLYFSF